MQRILNQRTLRRVMAARPMLVGITVPEPPARFCCCVLRRSLPPPTGRRWLSTSAFSKARGEAEAPDVDPLQDKSIGLVQRFKKTFKQYGKVLIPVHLVTSSIWFGTFYYAAMKGVNVVPFLKMIGLPESIVDLLRDSSSGYALTIATPARYTVTLGGTSLSLQYLRKHGYLSTPPPTKEKLTEKMEETKERFSEKMEETKERLSEKMEETKDKLSEKLQETKDRVSERKTFFRKKND
uniref:DUF1279 domain-containing protein n=1 Tax=Mola mola TaxID=94237 RepID=A0A3Q3XJG3_MOLML